MAKDVNATADAFAHDTLVAITLDNCEETFSVSRALLCNASEYFRKALNGQFSEAGTKQLRFPGCTVEVFRHFLYYLVEKDLPDFVHAVDLSGGEEDLDDKELARLAEPYHIRAIRIWVFADAYLMPKLQNVAMRQLIALFGRYHLTIAVVQTAFELTDRGSVLYDVIVREALSEWKFQHFGDEDVNKLGLIDGFMAPFVRALAHCPTFCKHEPSCFATKESESHWMVKED